MARSRALGDPLIWLGLAAAVVFFMATGAVAYLNFQTLKTDSAASRPQRRNVDRFGRRTLDCEGRRDRPTRLSAHR